MQWRDGLLILLSVIVGPPIAALVALLGLGVVQHGFASLRFFDIQFYTSTLLFAYILGWLPMLVAGIADAVVARFVSEPWRLLLALPAGAIPILFNLSWLAETEQGLHAGELLALGLGGGAASLICVALVEAFGPKLQKPE